uniref:Uncharacterized protein n=1 Tax=Anguilla anguilla TaxID=7936 RepID=A0A0E9R289_ANGAN
MHHMEKSLSLPMWQVFSSNTDKCEFIASNYKCVWYGPL